MKFHQSIPLFCLFFLSFSLRSQTTDSTKVLFIGNSITYFNDMFLTFQDMANNKGQAVRAESYTFHGHGYLDHVYDPNVYAKFRSETWDVVVLQPNLIECYGTQPTDSTLKFGRRMLDSIYLYSPCARVFMYEIPFKVPTDSTYYLYFSHQQTMRDTVRYMSDSLGMQMVPAGEAFQVYYHQHENLLLNVAYQDPHPTPYGSYLIASTFYAALFRDSISGCTHYGTIPEDTAHLFFSIVDSLVLNHLDFWHIPEYTTVIESSCGPFTAENGIVLNTSGEYLVRAPNQNGCDTTYRLQLTVHDRPMATVSLSPPNTLVASPSGMDAYYWVTCFPLSTVLGIQQTLQLDSGGAYVVLRDQNGCIDTSDCFSLTSGLAEQEFNEFFQLHFNPENGHYSIELDQPQQKIDLMLSDMHGRVIKNLTFLNAEKIEFELQEQVGMYLLHVRSDQKTYTRPIMHLSDFQ